MLRFGKPLLLAILACAFLNGCFFAPKKYGSRGCVGPESEQYQLYLANCRRTSGTLNAACLERGNPDLIEIGSSGGYFLWRNPTRVLAVHSFGRTTEILGIPKSMRRYLERKEGRSIASEARVRSRSQPATPVQVQMSTASAKTFEPNYHELSFDYNDDTRRGIITIKFRPGWGHDARRYAIQRIETRARESNVALRTGQSRQEGMYRIGDERTKDGNVLEIEFETL